MMRSFAIPDLRKPHRRGDVSAKFKAKSQTADFRSESKGGLPELSDDSTSFELIDSGRSSSRSLPNGVSVGGGVTWVELMRGNGSR